MQRASALLGESIKRSGRHALHQAGTVQRQVVAQLDELIAELSKQCQGGQCPPGEQQPQPSQNGQPKPASSQSSASRGSTAARDSSDPLNRTQAEPAEKADVHELAKGLWGHLPQRRRDEMLQSFSDEFLPKYELEIEAYYRRLSEEQE
jgi:hypothetical protein